MRLLVYNIEGKIFKCKSNAHLTRKPNNVAYYVNQNEYTNQRKGTFYSFNDKVVNNTRRHFKATKKLYKTFENGVLN